MDDDLLSPEQRRLLAEGIAASRRELEAIAEKIDLSPLESFEAIVRPSVGHLLREVRAELVQVWHRVNAETSWPGAMRGPIRVNDLSPLLQGAMIDVLHTLDVQPRFEITEELLAQLADRDFPDGTAIELSIERQELKGCPQASLAVALIPGERYLVLLAGWLIGQVRSGEEWPKACRVHSKIGPLRADQWSREDLTAFLQLVTEEFHSAIAIEMRSCSESAR
jgi:hypothetical protein